MLMNVIISILDAEFVIKKYNNPALALEGSLALGLEVF